MAGRPNRRRASGPFRPEVLPGGGPPALHAREAEDQVAGALALAPDAVARALAAGLDFGHFERVNPCGLVFAAAVALHEAGVRVDAPAIAAELERRGELAGMGGRGALALLAENTPTAANVVHHAARIIEAAQARAELAAHVEAARAAGLQLVSPSDAVETAAGERGPRTPTALEAEIIARATEAVPTHAGHYYAAAAEDFPGGVIVAGREDPHVLYRWAPRVTRRLLMQDSEGIAAPVVYTLTLPDGRTVDSDATEVRKGELWDRTGLPVNTRRHQGLMADIVALEAASLPGTIGSERMGWHELPDGRSVFVRPDGRCWPADCAALIVPVGMPAAAVEAARPPAELPTIDEQRVIVGGLAEIGTGAGRGLPLLEVGRGLRALGSSWHPARSTVVMECRNGGGKSGLAMFGRGVLLGRDYPPDATSTFRNTANRIAVDLATEADAPALLDDYSAVTREDPLRSRQATEAIDTLLRTSADGGEARGRLTKDSRKMAARLTRTFAAVTCEEFPRGLYGSSIRRMVLLRWQEGELPVEVGGSYLPDTAGTLAWHYRRSWPTLRALGDAVVAMLGERGREPARELLAERDVYWTAALTGELAAAGADVTNHAMRAAPILTGVELAERVLDLEAGTLTRPATAALLPHLVRQAALYVQTNAASADLAQQLGATVRESLLSGRAHLASQADRVDAAEFPSLTAQAAGYREWTQNGSAGWDASSGRGVRLWGVEGEWVGTELANLHSLLRMSREDLWARYSPDGLGAALLEAGGLIRSEQKGSAASWVTRIGGKVRRVVRIPWGLVHAHACEDELPVTGVTPVTPVTPGAEPNTDEAHDAVTGAVTGGGAPSPEPARSEVLSGAAAVTAVTPVTPVTGADVSPVRVSAREGDPADDPRPDLQDDADLWRLVLAVSMAPDVTGTLRGARASGARLDRLPAARGSDRPRLRMGPRIGPDAFADTAEWETFRREYLMPVAAEVTAVLDVAARQLPSADVAAAKPARGKAPERSPADPSAVIATLAPDGRLLGRATVDRVEVGPGMLRDALAAVAGAKGRQLVLAGRPSEWLGMTIGRRGAAVAREWPALEAAKAGAWTFSAFDPQAGKREAGWGVWTDARHPELTPSGRWVTLHIPEFEPTVRSMPDLSADDMHAAAALASRALGRRWQEWEGRGFRELVKLLRPAADEVLTAAELPPASDQETEPKWDREVTDAEWEAAGRLWVFDRSGSYLSGLGIAVGRGELERLDAAAATAAAGAKTLRPGSWHVRLTGPDPLTARGLPPALDRAEGESRVPAPTLGHLRELRAPLEVLGAALWPATGATWWRPVAERMATARDELMARDGPAARAALDVVKATYTKGIQMLNRANGAAGQPWHRPDVHAAITQQSRANLLRAVGKAKLRPVAWVLKDSVAWLLPAAIEDPAAAAAAIGLRYGRRPGLWHEAGSWPVAEVRAPMALGLPADARSRALAIVAERRGLPGAPGEAAGRPLASVVAELLRRARRDG